MTSIFGVATLYHCSALCGDIVLEILLETWLRAGKMPFWRDYPGKHIGYQEIKRMVEFPRNHVGMY